MDNTSTLKENLYMWCPLEVEAILALLQLEIIADDTPEGGYGAGSRSIRDEGR